LLTKPYKKSFKLLRTSLAKLSKPYTIPVNIPANIIAGRPSANAFTASRKAKLVPTFKKLAAKRQMKARITEILSRHETWDHK
jgi:hypothetical protein